MKEHRPLRGGRADEDSGVEGHGCTHSQAQESRGVFESPVVSP